MNDEKIEQKDQSQVERKQQYGTPINLKAKIRKSQKKSEEDLKVKIISQDNRVASPSPNSNSFNQMFDQFYPRTPIKLIKESAGKQQIKDQLDQLIGKGILKMALVQQVTFNSTKKFDIFKGLFEKQNFDEFGAEMSQKLICLKVQFEYYQIKQNKLQVSNCYEKKGRVEQNDQSLLGKMNFQSINWKQQYFTTLLSLYKNFRVQIQEGFSFVFANSGFLVFFCHISLDVLLHPVVLFITRSSASHKGNYTEPPFLQNNFIKSDLVTVAPFLSNLIPQQSLIQFPTKYSLSLIRGKYIHHLFNCLVNSNFEKDTIDIYANFPFPGSSSQIFQVYNGVDYSVFQNQIQQPFNDFFIDIEPQQEYEIRFEGMQTIEQILELKEMIKQIGFADIVVSDLKLNPVTTLLTQINLKIIQDIIKNDHNK